MVKGQRGSNSRSSRNNNNNNNRICCFEARLHLPMSLKTFDMIKSKQSRRNERRTPGSTVKFFDQTHPCYRWLLPGWLAEERRMPSGRLYRYYYDPEGNLYRTKYEVLYAWQQCGIISLDHYF